MLHYALRGSGYIDVALTPSHDAFWSHSHRLALWPSLRDPFFFLFPRSPPPPPRSSTRSTRGMRPCACPPHTASHCCCSRFSEGVRRCLLPPADSTWTTPPPRTPLVLSPRCTSHAPSASRAPPTSSCLRSSNPPTSSEQRYGQCAHGGDDALSSLPPLPSCLPHTGVRRHPSTAVRTCTHRHAQLCRNLMLASTYKTPLLF
jgi:hypothetical protein